MLLWVNHNYVQFKIIMDTVNDKTKINFFMALHSSKNTMAGRPPLRAARFLQGRRDARRVRVARLDAASRSPTVPLTWRNAGRHAITTLRARTRPKGESHSRAWGRASPIRSRPSHQRLK